MLDGDATPHEDGVPYQTLLDFIDVELPSLPMARSLLCARPDVDTFCASRLLGGRQYALSPRGLAVVFGNALTDDATPKPILAARLDAALRCHREGKCPVLFVSGSIDGPGLDEAAAMQRYLMERGVPASQIVVDDKGDNTLATARNAVGYMRAHGMSSVMLVSQCHHLARAQLAFARAGALDISGTYPRTLQLIDFYSAWREVPAYAVYRVRLALNPDAEAVSFRPMLFLLKTFGWSRS
ncbi:YdcF family protein [Caballeronia sp. LZ019]|uniref:YdcF family protein n=1 Tax=Caballeronia sp. LZ019 TaxID=3038555 RepID=UPI00286B4785|nr:YdcF family protein [Caballeronia sp. LZ019]